MMLPSIIQRLQRAAQPEFSEFGIVFVDRKEQEEFFSWKQLYVRAQKAAGRLSKLGIKKDDRIAIILPTCVEFIDALLGCQLIGAIPIPLYPPVRLGKLDEYFNRTSNMLREANVCALITNRKIKRILGQLLARYKPSHGIILSSSASSSKP